MRRLARLERLFRRAQNRLQGRAARHPFTTQLRCLQRCELPHGMMKPLIKPTEIVGAVPDILLVESPASMSMVKLIAL